MIGAVAAVLEAEVQDAVPKVVWTSSRPAILIAPAPVATTVVPLFACLKWRLSFA